MTATLAALVGNVVVVSAPTAETDCSTASDDGAQAAELPPVAAATRNEPPPATITSPAAPSRATAPKPGKRRRGRPYDAQPTRDALRAALARCGKRRTPDDAIRGLLAHYGIGAFREMPEDKIADAIKKLNDLPGA